MRVRTLFFAAYRDLLGVSQLDVDVAEGSTVSQLVAELRGRGGRFESLPRQPAIAVNRTYSRHDAPLFPGDEVAFIPPVAGG
jgi:molybdopterin converting factor subunit 1